jgi:hypothetical protein
MQFLQNICIQTLALALGLGHDFTMYFGRHAHQKFLGEWLLGIFPSGSAELQVIVDRILKSPLQLLDRRSLKGDHVPCVDHFTVKHARFFVQIHSCLIALVGHDFPPIPLRGTSAWRQRRHDRSIVDKAAEDVDAEGGCERGRVHWLSSSIGRLPDRRRAGRRTCRSALWSIARAAPCRCAACSRSLPGSPWRPG